MDVTDKLMKDVEQTLSVPFMLLLLYLTLGQTHTVALRP